MVEVERTRRGSRKKRADRVRKRGGEGLGERVTREVALDRQRERGRESSPGVGEVEVWATTYATGVPLYI